MRNATLNRRSLAYHWRTNLAVVLGAAVATAALTGALIVGDSMRASLAEIALGRLGRVDHALIAPRFFQTDLAQRVSDDAAYSQTYSPAVPVILMQGAATHAESRSRAGRVNIVGVDESFWTLARDNEAPSGPRAPLIGANGEGIILNDALAAELNAKVGDDVVLRLRQPSAVSMESLLGRRDEAAATLRSRIAAIIPARGLGGFSIESRQTAPKNAFVPLATLQRSLKCEGRANALLIAGAGADKAGPTSKVQVGDQALQEIIGKHVTLADLGLRLRAQPTHAYVALESDAILISPPVEATAMEAAGAIGALASPILTHLANSITLIRGSESPDGDGDGSSSAPSIPYSTIAAIEPDSATAISLRPLVREGGALAGAGDILLNRWAADDLGAKPGDRVEVTYYVSGPLGRLDTRHSPFTLRGIVELEGAATDAGFVPDYPGVTDTQNLADWDPPFPLDLKRVRDKDEDYWDEYRTAPKAFVSLEEGQGLWAEDERLGRMTSIRISGPAESAPNSKASDAVGDGPDVNPLLAASEGDTTAGDLADLATRFERALLASLSPRDLGLAVQPVRANALAASRGATDFGGLFIGFSLFLIAAAAMLVGLLFRLGVERRAAEIGTLLSMGFTPRAVAINLVGEGLALSAIGAALGLAVASGYAWLMLAGLRSWWSSAVNSPFLTLHALPRSYAIGFLASVMIAGGSAAWAVRGLTRRSPRSLLAGAIEAPGASGVRRLNLGTIVSICGFLFALLLVLAAAAGLVSPVLSFFLAGALVLIGALAAFGIWLRQPRGRLLHVPGALALLRLAARNAPRHRGRSMLTAGLIASATFVILALEAFRLEAKSDAQDLTSGTGGFSVFAESAVPLPYDLNTPEGRDALGIDEPLLSANGNAQRDGGRAAGPREIQATGPPSHEVFSFRLRPGDESSCLNLYVPVQPRILGAPDRFVERGGFAFAAALDDEVGAASENPWRLLHNDLGNGVIPAVADEAAVTWQLRSGLGKDFEITDQRGNTVRLRFVALLKGSVLQDEIVISEANFTRLFPGIEGHSFFLVDAPPDRSQPVEQTLERELERFGFDAGSTVSRLAAYNSVQNTYLSTFQTLGGLGLILGTLGLAAILLRNVWERRRELAIMRATGFSRAGIAASIMLENLLLVVVGLVSGSLAAGVAVAPRLINHPESIPLGSFGLLLGLVVLAGGVAGGLGVLSMQRLNVVGSLRAE